MHFLRDVRFGNLVAIYRVKGGWRCLCDCGNATTARTGNLLSGATKSCGCGVRKHGLSSTRAYASWVAMWRRCTNEKATGYPRYGGRGIRVCERWKNVENFIADMGERPQGKSIDRIDNDGNYEPGNCRWATPAEQSRNRGMESRATGGEQ